jgi:hypothetical protein
MEIIDKVLADFAAGHGYHIHDNMSVKHWLNARVTYLEKSVPYFHFAHSNLHTEHPFTEPCVKQPQLASLAPSL